MERKSNKSCFRIQKVVRRIQIRKNIQGVGKYKLKSCKFLVDTAFRILFKNMYE